jgi:hypothetical protein
MQPLYQILQSRMAAVTLHRTRREVPLSLTLVKHFDPAYYLHTYRRTHIGPKMYSALRDKNNVGSTRLHLDVTDAFNVLPFAHEHGCAIWWTFARKDADALAAWLRKRYNCQGHPIHQQQIFLTENDLRDLWDEAGIRPYIIRQRPNETVLIPSGCAHQVRHSFRPTEILRSMLHFISPYSG